MSKATGIKGYTPDRLRRAQQAQIRQAERDLKSVRQQLDVIKGRPGNSAKETKRLNDELAS